MFKHRPVAALLTLALGALALNACATATGPEAAIHAAAAAAPNGVDGSYALRVVATGRQDGNIYLNSEADYRDQRNLTVAIHPSAIAPLTKRLGGEPDTLLKGKTITVRGLARRVRVDFTDEGRPTGKYYYQTHVDVTDAGQLSIAGG